ncbi:ATP-binding cassette domain-containing protein, partial [Gemmatimonadota bacterium]
GVDLTVARGDRMAIMGPNGIGKSTLLKIVMGELEPDAGTVKWGYETHPGYFAQDHQEQFENAEHTAEAWIAGFAPGKTYGFVRGEMGRVLFSGDDGKKKLGSLSGGEAARLVFCKLAIEQPNVLVLDEPTNHLDLESIEALVEALRSFDGTLILVSHDRWFVSRLANRIVEITADGLRDYQGTYEDYVHFCGDDHLDVDTVVLQARKEKRVAKKGAKDEARKVGRPNRDEVRELKGRRDQLTTRIEETEARIEEIDMSFADPSFYDRAAAEEVREMEGTRSGLQAELDELLALWEQVESELEQLP